MPAISYSNCGMPGPFYQYQCSGNIIQQRSYTNSCALGGCYTNFTSWFNYENCDSYDGCDSFSPTTYLDWYCDPSGTAHCAFTAYPFDSRCISCANGSCSPNGSTRTCGSGECAGTQTCSSGCWSDCSTSGNICGEPPDFENVGSPYSCFYCNGNQLCTTCQDYQWVRLHCSSAGSCSDREITQSGTSYYDCGYVDGQCGYTAPPSTYSLTITKSPVAGGTVTTNPSGINCGSTCSYNFSSGQGVILIASPAGGYVFSGWTGNSDCTDGQVTMDSAKSCQANFSVAPSFDFSIADNPTSGNVIQGSAVVTTVSLALTSGTSQSVSFSASNLPSGVSASFSPTSCSPNCNSSLTLTTQSSTVPGNYSINVCGTGGGQNHCVTYGLNVLSAAVVPSAPNVTTGTVVASSTSAVIYGTLNSLGNTPLALVWFEWGTTTSYGNVTSYVSRTTTGEFSATISGLNQNTTYYYRARARNGGSW